MIMSMRDHQYPVSARTVSDRAACQRVLMELLHSWPEVPDEAASSGLLDHVCGCPRCLQRLIALDAALELTSQPQTAG